MPKRKKIKVLEIGAGINPRIPSGKHVSKKYIEIKKSARKQLKEKGLKVIKGTAQKIPLKSNSRDVVEMHNVISGQRIKIPILDQIFSIFKGSKTKALKEVHRVLKPGGKLIITNSIEVDKFTFRDAIKKAKKLGFVVVKRDGKEVVKKKIRFSKKDIEEANIVILKKKEGKIFTKKGNIILEHIFKTPTGTTLAVLADKETLKRARDIGGEEGLKNIEKSAKFDYPTNFKQKRKIEREFKSKNAPIRFRHTPIGDVVISIKHIKNEKNKEVKVLNINHFYPRIHLKAKSVGKPAKREGIGIATINELKDLAKILKIDHIDFSTPKRKAKELFEREGFEPISTSDAGDGTKWTEFRYKMPKVQIGFFDRMKKIVSDKLKKSSH